MNEIEKKSANSAILLDLGGVLFEKNPNPEKVYENIMNLYGGKNIDEMAVYFNLQDELETIKRTEEYQKRAPKAAAYLAGELLIDKLLEKREIDKTALINARIDAVRKRDDKILESIRKNFPYINIGIATQDGQSIHDVINYYFPEVEEKFQVVSTDVDINASKTAPEYYYNASKRLYIPTQNMALVDDSKDNNKAMEEAGGIGGLFDPNDPNQNLENTVIQTIEQSMRR